jgi:hypothetical protein
MASGSWSRPSWVKRLRSVTGPHVVVIEVDVAGAQVGEGVEEPGGRHQVLGVTPVARSFGDHHLPRAQPAEGLHRGRDDGGVGIDHARRVELHEVRLEHDLSSDHGDAELAQALEHHLGQRHRVVAGGKDGDP